MLVAVPEGVISTTVMRSEYRYKSENHLAERPLPDQSGKRPLSTPGAHLNRAQGPCVVRLASVRS